MNKNNVRIILKRTNTGGHGEKLSEDYKTIEIDSEEIEKLIAIGDGYFGPFDVVGSELIDPDASHEKYKSFDLDEEF